MISEERPVVIGREIRRQIEQGFIQPIHGFLPEYSLDFLIDGGVEERGGTLERTGGFTLTLHRERVTYRTAVSVKNGFTTSEYLDFMKSETSPSILEQATSKDYKPFSEMIEGLAAIIGKNGVATRYRLNSSGLIYDGEAVEGNIKKIVPGYRHGIFTYGANKDFKVVFEPNYDCRNPFGKLEVELPFINLPQLGSQIVTIEKLESFMRDLESPT